MTSDRPAVPSPDVLLVLSDHPRRGAALVDTLRRAGRTTIGPMPCERMLVGLQETAAAALILDLSSFDESGRGWLRMVQDLTTPPILIVRCPRLPTSAITTLFSAGVREYVAAEASEADLVDTVDRALGWEHATPGDLEPGEFGARIAATRQATAARGLASLEALTAIVEAQDEHLAGHSWRVGDLAASIAAAMGWSDDSIEEVRIGGQLHDLGMLVVPRSVLQKAGALTNEELALVRTHPSVGARIVRPLVSAEIQAAIRGHHERWDGTGYPDRVAGPAIPRGARVLAAAETFDALVSARAHRGALSEAEALERLGSLAGGALDPAVVLATETAVRSKARLHFLQRDTGFALEIGLLPPDYRSVLDAAVAEAPRLD